MSLGYNSYSNKVVLRVKKSHPKSYVENNRHRYSIKQYLTPWQ